MALHRETALDEARPTHDSVADGHLGAVEPGQGVRYCIGVGGAEALVLVDVDRPGEDLPVAPESALNIDDHRLLETAAAGGLPLPAEDALDGPAGPFGHYGRVDRRLGVVLDAEPAAYRRLVPPAREVGSFRRGDLNPP